MDLLISLTIIHYFDQQAPSIDHRNSNVQKEASSKSIPQVDFSSMTY